MDNEISKKHKNMWVRILVPVLMIAVIFGIYIFKNVQEDKNNNQEEAQNINEEILPLSIDAVDLDEIKAYGVPFVIDFGSDSCIPCKQMAPVLETLHSEWQGEAIVHMFYLGF